MFSIYDYDLKRLEEYDWCVQHVLKHYTWSIYTKKGLIIRDHCCTMQEAMNHITKEVMKLKTKV